TILSALQSNPLYRLKRTWASVSRYLLENNHGMSREILTKEEVPLRRTNCARNEPRHLQRSASQAGLINFEKRRKEYEVLAKIQKLQLTCRHYVLTAKPEILRVFYSQRQLTEDQSYRISCTIEPPACPNSPRICRKLTKCFSYAWRYLNRSTAEPGTPPTTPRHDDQSHFAPRSLVSPSSTQPLYNQQIADLCIIRVSMENTHGNMYKSILLTSQDKSHAVIQRSLQKHNIESCQPDVFQLVQLLSERKELTIPDSANVYYSTNTTANFDFVLRWRTRES
ncbi:hypothetical protein XELAEV_18000752mg, partial [Xenopus laevis]